MLEQIDQRDLPVELPAQTALELDDEQGMAAEIEEVFVQPGVGMWSTSAQIVAMVCSRSEPTLSAAALWALRARFSSVIALRI